MNGAMISIAGGNGSCLGHVELFPELDRGTGRALVRHHRMAGVGLVLDQHFPVALMHVSQRRPGNLEPAGGRAVDHVVERRQRFAEELLERNPVSARRQKMKPR
jgi:hypothetical protein